MKGSNLIIDILNALLADELTAINQYMVHAEIAANFGYEKLHTYLQKRAKDEMIHAERLIDRILFLEGTPEVTKLNQIKIALEVPSQFNFDHSAEFTAITHYNEAIAQAAASKDFATKELLDDILKDEDRHLHEIEEYQIQVQQMTLANFLSTQS